MIFPKGFYISSVKEKTKNNFSFIYAPEGMKSAGVFTTNLCAAHPVIFSKENISKPMHKLILVNKGSANAATGDEGLMRMEAMVKEGSEGFGVVRDEVLVASTGVIGKQIEIEANTMAELILKKERVEPDEFAEAIMTTDTRKKILYEVIEIEGNEITVMGIAKGSGMIAPNMATMLGFVITDIDIKKELLQKALDKVTKSTFNCLVVDGETSTNDTVFLAASGKAGNILIDNEDENFNKFYSALEKICIGLVEMLAADGEGATKFVKINVSGAVNDSSASQAARAIAVSPLCKTAFYGCSPNWGRIVSAMGAAQIEFSMDKFDLSVDEIAWLKSGDPCEENMDKIRNILEQGSFCLDIELNNGNGQASAYTCDYSPEYIRINAHYLS
jgi:glutamate N-acetyltransferase/amino-acid N-acetyltransferase